MDICAYCERNNTSTYLCEQCILFFRNIDSDTLIFKSYVKDWFIKPDLLNPIEKSFINRYHKKTTQYKLADVIYFFCLKYGINQDDPCSIITKRNQLIKERENRAKKREENKRKNEPIRLKKEAEKRNKRQEILVNALNRYGLELRSDSQLCNGYIDGTIKDWSLDEIVERMCQMKYLFEYMNMKYYLDKIYHEQKMEREFSKYYPTQTVFEEAEEYVLSKIKGYPKTWPWMEISS
jgi:hypothetical protein